MNPRVLVIGAGMGGLSAALRLKQHGFDVLVLEARDTAGGLASGLRIDGIWFDGGPYILLDRPGLEWLFDQIHLDLQVLGPLLSPDPVYEVNFSGGNQISIHRDLDKTANVLEASYPGSGKRYRAFVEEMKSRHDALRSFVTREHPTALEIVRTGAWRQAAFLLQSLERVLGRAGLPGPIKDAIGIWTHVAGQSRSDAPSPMAFVSALIHTAGAYYPAGGVRAIPGILIEEASRAGIQIRYGAKVMRILCPRQEVEGVMLENGERIACEAVVSNAHGLATYEDLTREYTGSQKESLLRLPLQSPGVCHYLKIRRKKKFPYLRFFLPGGGQLCRLFISPGNLEESMGEWEAARIVAPMSYEDARQRGTQGQHEFAEQILRETWWRDGIAEFQCLGIRVPVDWGAEFNLYRDSMNPVMTSSSVRKGRLAHRSPWIRRLYLAGASTDPGQWVSFSGISGILAADCVAEDLS